MDNLTHTLVGAVAAEGFFKEKVGPEALPVLCWASNLPDIDTIVLLTRDPGAITLRRTFGHSALLLPLWCAGLAWLFKKLYPHKRYSTLLGLCLLGAFTHVFFDLINSFGVVVAWPLSLFRPELAIVFIVDLILTGLLLAPFLATRLAPFRGRLRDACRASAALVCAYILLCAGARARAETLLHRETASPMPDFSYVFPEPLGPQRWRGVARYGDEYRLYKINALTGSLALAALAKTDRTDASVAAVERTSPLARRLLAFYKAPVWQVSPDPEGGADVRVYDLRFRTLFLDRGRPFSYLFRVRPDGAVEERGRAR